MWRTFFFTLLFLVLVVSSASKALEANSADFHPQQSIAGENSPGKRKLKISGKALKSENIVVKEGERVSAGQVLISRELEINQLNLAKSKILERLEYLKSREIVPPVAPEEKPYPLLPPVNFEAETMRIEAIANRCDRIEATLAETKEADVGYFSRANIDRLERFKQQKARELAQAQDLLNNLQSLNFGVHYVIHQEQRIKQITEEMQRLDADVLVATGELQERLSQANQAKSAAIAQTESRLVDCRQQLAIAKADLLESQHRRQILEQNYQQALAIHTQEQAKLFQEYQRDLVRYNEQLQSQQLAIFTANQELAQLELRLNEITEVKSPYAGQITKFKVNGSHDGYLDVEFILVY